MNQQPSLLGKIKLFKAVFLLKGQIFNVKGIHTVNHGLNQLNFRVAQSVFVGNIIGHTSLATRFSPGTTGLKSQFFAPSLQCRRAFLGPAGQVNVDRGPHASTQVGGAGVQVTQSGMQHEVTARFSFDRITNSLDSPCQSFEDSSDITACRKTRRI